MNNSIYEENKKFIFQWINFNPNFNGLEFKNNILKYKDMEIDLKTFLVSELLNNKYFVNNVYTMKINEFLKIINLHVKSILISAQNNEQYCYEDDEYIKNIKINSLKRAMIITNKREIELMGINANDVLNKYSLLLLKDNYYVSLNELLDKNNNDTNNLFFRLLQNDNELGISEYNYIKHVSNFIFQLNDNEYVLVDKAKNLLNTYMFEMNKLKQLSVLNHAQKFALKLYDNYIKILEEEHKKNEELNALNSSHSYGYSSLVLIITSVISTTLVFLFIMICN